MTSPIVLITGASRGIGAATARLAAKRGFDVAISYLKDRAAAEAVVADVAAAGRPTRGLGGNNRLGGSVARREALLQFGRAKSVQAFVNGRESSAFYTSI